MRGRKPKTEHLVDKTLAVAEPPPDPPEWLDPDAREEWYRIAALLSARRILSPLDYQLLASYCQTYSMWKRFSIRMRDEGETVQDGKGEMKLHACAKHTVQLLQEMRRLAAEFGLTPVARYRAKAPDATGDTTDDDDFD